MLLTAPRDVTASTNAGTLELLHETDDASAHQNSAVHTCIWLAMVRSVSPKTEHAPAKAMTVSPESSTATVGGGGAWPDNESTRRTRHRRPGTTGVEGAGGSGGHGRASRRVPARTAPQAPPTCRTPEVWRPGCGARGWWQGLAGLRTPSVHQVPPVWRARRARRARLPCPWAVAGPGRASNTISTPGAAGVEGAGGSGGPGCRARGRWRGLAGLRTPSVHQAPPACRTPGVWGPGCRARGRWRGLAGLRTPSVHQVPPVWRAPEGPEGTGGLRHRPLRAAGSRVAISRAAGPDGAQNTSEAASNKLNRKFRLRHWCGGRRWDRTARPWCGGTAAPGPRAPGSGCAPASAPLGHCPHHLGPRHAGRTRAHLGLSGAVEP